MRQGSRLGTDPGRVQRQPQEGDAGPYRFGRGDQDVVPALPRGEREAQHRVEVPGLGGMGFHYSNPAYVEDGGAVNLLQPELLLYEPQKTGQLRFIGVEYIVLFSDHPATEPPPTLLGQAFEAVPDAGLWGLHIYVG